MSSDLAPVLHGRDGRAIPPEVIAAARKCYLHFGVQRATVSDVAAAAGMPRQAIYEYISSRNELIAAALVQRISEIANDLKPAASRSRDFRRAFVETSVSAITLARSDAELMNFFQTGPGELVNEVVAGPSREIHDIVRDLLGPILDTGQRSAKLRTDQTRDQMIDWIRLVYTALITQSGVDDHRIRAAIADYLLPSISAPAAATR
jgi:AcrR family transcriptional regulator